MSKTRVVSTRMTVEDLAKARDGLINKNIPPIELTSTSHIIKLAFYYGIMYLCEDPKSPPSQESIDFIRQKFDKSKTAKSINDLEE